MAESGFIKASGELMAELACQAARLHLKWLDTISQAKQPLRDGKSVAFENLTPGMYLDLVTVIGALEKEGYKVTLKTRMRGAGPILLDCELTATKKEG